MKPLTVKLSIHSIIDLITNSSTEIFINCSDTTIDKCKELVNEFLIALNITDRTCDDLFDLSLEYEEGSVDNYREMLEYDDYEEEQKEEFEKFVKGEIEMPDWIEDYHLERVLVIKPRSFEYEKTAKALTAFLFSTDAYEHSWG